MLNRNTFSRYSIAALVSALALEPTLAQAASCVGPKVNWGSTSNAFGLCGTLSSRGRSFGQFNSQGGIRVPFRLSAELFDGIHAYAFAYNSQGIAFSGCFPFDDTEGDGAARAEGAGCIGGVKHQVVVIY